MEQVTECPLRIFLARMDLLVIGDFYFDSILTGGGTNITAKYRNGEVLAVAKFFFMGPSPVAHKKLRNEIDRQMRGWELTKVTPKVYREFHSTDGFVRGYLMEHITGVSLTDAIPEAGYSTTWEAAAAFFRVCWAYHHTFMGVVHGDLHPGNIIFESGLEDWLTRRPEFPEVRILDLGASISPYDFGYPESFEEDMWDDFHRRYAGSFYSLAPEFLTADYYKSIAYAGVFDSWGLGLLLHKMATGKLLQIADSLGEYVELIHSGSLQYQLDRQIDENCQDYHLRFLIKAMLRVKTGDRMPLHVATSYAGLLYNNDPCLLDKRHSDLEKFVRQGCDPEAGLPPHERSNSPY